MANAVEETEAEAAFRTRVREWLAANAAEYAAPPAKPWSEDELVERSHAWQRRKAATGFGAVSAPTAIGGAGLGGEMANILFQEERRYHTPTFIGQSIGLNMSMAVILKHGSPEQIRRFLTPTVTGEVSWCQLFSEPAAGSDLAGLRTRAVRDGDRWIVNGQKVWSSWAHRAAYGILLARSDPSKPKHEGLSFFVLDMKTPGVEVRPIRQITGKSDFNEVFFTDVVIPDQARIGAVGEGWACAMTVLSAERHLAGGRDEKVAQVRELIELARQTRRGDGSALDSSEVRAKVAQWYVEEQGVRHFGARVQEMTAAGQPPPPTMPLMKLVSANKLQQTTAFRMDLREFTGLFDEPAEMERDDIFYQYMWAAARRIAGGADEVLRNQLAERALGMPQDPRMDKGVPFDKLPG
ncbi:MAG TPA: acyl-CoA dehydrogenase family protein [Caulobacteraceae bacterium]|nr:acyl-CoA dehydrogenase family protein [Caulobacteraceae bacterium]